jgi:hypothetical protein
MSTTVPVLIGGGPALQSVYETSTTAKHELGTRGRLPDGREFEYVRSQHATAIGKGKLATYDPVAAAVDKLDVAAAAAIGDTSVSVTVATTSDNQYAGAYLSVEEGPGEAETYRITRHLLHATTTVFYIDRPLVVALTTATNVTIVKGPGAVKISAAVATLANPVEVAAGVPLVSVGAGDTTNQYFWVQKTGLATVLFGTLVGAVGDSVYAGEDAGSFQNAVLEIDTTVDIKAKVSLGTVFALLPIDTEYHTVMLNIP